MTWKRRLKNFIWTHGIHTTQLLAKLQLYVAKNYLNLFHPRKSKSLRNLEGWKFVGTTEKKKNVNAKPYKCNLRAKKATRNPESSKIVDSNKLSWNKSRLSQKWSKINYQWNESIKVNELSYAYSGLQNNKPTLNDWHKHMTGIQGKYQQASFQMKHSKTKKIQVIFANLKSRGLICLVKIQTTFLKWITR